MPKPPLPDELQKVLRNPNPAIIGSVAPDGAPNTVATWYLWEDGRVLVNMDEGRKRLDHVRNDPRVTLTVLDDDDWYTHVTLIGHVAELRDDDDLADVDRLARHYLGGPYPQRERRRVSALIDIDRWHGWGEFRDSDQPSG